MNKDNFQGTCGKWAELSLNVLKTNITSSEWPQNIFLTTSEHSLFNFWSVCIRSQSDLMTYVHRSFSQTRIFYLVTFHQLLTVLLASSDWWSSASLVTRWRCDQTVINMTEIAGPLIPVYGVSCPSYPDGFLNLPGGPMALSVNYSCPFSWHVFNEFYLFIMTTNDLNTSWTHSPICYSLTAPLVRWMV